MSELFHKIQTDYNDKRAEAYRAKTNPGAYGVLGLVIADAIKMTKDRPEQPLTDADMVTIIRKQIKGNDESMALSGIKNPRLVAENEVMQAYLPTMLSQDQIVAIFNEQKFGKLSDAMKYFKDSYAGKYDGKVLADYAKSVL